MAKRLLIVAHAPSENTLSLREATERGARSETGIELRIELGQMLARARLQLARAPRALPSLRINPDIRDLAAFRFEDFSLQGYEPHPHIKAKVAV